MISMSDRFTAFLVLLLVLPCPAARMLVNVAGGANDLVPAGQRWRDERQWLSDAAAKTNYSDPAIPACRTTLPQRTVSDLTKSYIASTDRSSNASVASLTISVSLSGSPTMAH